MSGAAMRFTTMISPGAGGREKEILPNEPNLGPAVGSRF